MNTPSSAAKVCIACGADCSNKPRTKDAQGRYTCKECYEKLLAAQKQKAAARAAAPTPVAAATTADDGYDGDDGVMASLLQNSDAITETCPSCGSGMTAGSVVCTICGYNKETGKAMGIKTLKAPKEKRGPGLGEMLLNPTYTAIAAIVVFGGLFALAMVSPIGVLLYVLLGALYCAAFGLLLLIDAFRQGVGTGLLYLFVPFYAIYYLFVRCESAMIKTHVCLSIVVAVGVSALASQLEDFPAEEAAVSSATYRFV